MSQNFSWVITNLIFAKQPASNYVVIIAGDLVLEAYQTVFLSPPLRDYYKNFFCKNGLRYLGMEDGVPTTKQGIPATLRTRLNALAHSARQ